MNFWKNRDFCSIVISMYYTIFQVQIYKIIFKFELQNWNWRRYLLEISEQKLDPKFLPICHLLQRKKPGPWWPSNKCHLLIASGLNWNSYDVYKVKQWVWITGEFAQKKSRVATATVVIFKEKNTLWQNSIFVQ